MKVIWRPARRDSPGMRQSRNENRPGDFPSGRFVVPRARLELATHGFSVHCSTELSYLGTLQERRNSNRTRTDCQVG